MIKTNRRKFTYYLSLNTTPPPPKNELCTYEQKLIMKFQMRWCDDNDDDDDDADLDEHNVKEKYFCNKTPSRIEGDENKQSKYCGKIYELQNLNELWFLLVVMCVCVHRKYVKIPFSIWWMNGWDGEKGDGKWWVVFAKSYIFWKKKKI